LVVNLIGIHWVTSELICFLYLLVSPWYICTKRTDLKRGLNQFERISPRKTTLYISQFKWINIFIQLAGDCSEYVNRFLLLEVMLWMQNICLLDFHLLFTCHLHQFRLMYICWISDVWFNVKINQNILFIEFSFYWREILMAWTYTDIKAQFQYD
jgi:hypothetical protein